MLIITTEQRNFLALFAFIFLKYMETMLQMTCLLNKE